ncbi:MAG: hypothetical protein ACKVVT_14145 [Dehalococcoidia bacterium]
MSSRFPLPEADDEGPVIGLDYQEEDEDDPAAFLDDASDEESYDSGVYHAAPPNTRRSFSYDERTHASHPAFFIFVGLAVIVGAGAIFTLYSFIRNTDEDSGPTPTPVVVTTGLRAAILSPRTGTRVEAGKVQDFAIEVVSPQHAVTRYALFVNNEVAAIIEEVPPPTGDTYVAQMRYEFLQRGEYSVFVRVSTADGTFHDSPPITVIGQEAPGESARGLAGRVVARANVVAGPGPQFAVLGTANPDDAIRIFGRSRDGEWLLIDDQADRWVRRAAVQESDSLTLVPVREPRATVTASRSTTPTPSPSATVSATPSVDGPDLVPTDARFVIEGSRRLLRIIIANEGKPYAGPLVIGIATTPGGLAAGQNVVDAVVGTNETITLDLELTGTPPERTDIVVRADPQNLIPERSEDNNTVTFKSVPRPADPPTVSIGAVTPQGNLVTVVVRNTGGNLDRSKVVVTIKGATTTTTSEQNVAIAKNESVTFQVPSPGPGQATVVVTVNDVAVASGAVEIS